MDSEGVLLPLIHEHLMLFRNDVRKSDSCKLACNLCGRIIVDLYLYCEICSFVIDLYCANYPPPVLVDNLQRHGHPLTLLKDQEPEFKCDAKCGKIGDGFPYKCHECDLTFHIDCVLHPPSEVKYPSEVNHLHHALHPLKLIMGQLIPDYSDGKCYLCGSGIDDKLFYHCSLCNFSLDMRCVINPPPQSILDLKTHDHQLTLLPRIISFTCNVCGLNGDRSPYVCFQCNLMIHKDCFGLPRLININRHEHRVSFTNLLGVVNSICGVCREKVDWTSGGYSCKKCPDYVVHSECATNMYVWNGKELEGLPEELEDTEPYVVIDDNTIHHVGHKEHHLRLNANGNLWEENKRCNACTQPICLQSFYRCVLGCSFILHETCAGFPKKKWHDGSRILDVQCGIFSEPFVHPSHPQHPLYYILRDEEEECKGCNTWDPHMLRCIKDGCRFVLGFKCATLPQVVKHRVNDKPLLLCYGEKATGKYWCDICEKETFPETWFYTCEDSFASLHTTCVLGDFPRLMPRSTIHDSSKQFEVVLNDSVSRPLCIWCELHCMYPIILKMLETAESDTYICSYACMMSFIYPQSS